MSPHFDDGNLWCAWVDYDGTNVQVRANQTGIRPQTPHIIRPLNVVGILGKTNAYVGLTASTGNGWENVDVVSFYYRDSYNSITNVPAVSRAYTVIPLTTNK